MSNSEACTTAGVDLADAAGLLHLPPDICATVTRCLTLQSLGNLAACCQLLSHEASDRELWFELFMKVCWPPSAALAAFAEDGASCPTGVDWRARLQTRASSKPAIVVDCGRGYTKYGLVHGLAGRPEGDGKPPHLVQLCSSPTHPPDCDREDELAYVHEQIDLQLLRAASDPGDPLHRTATRAIGSAPLAAGDAAVLQNYEEKPELNGSLVRLVSWNETTKTWTAQTIPPPRSTRHNPWSQDSDEETAEHNREASPNSVVAVEGRVPPLAPGIHVNNEETIFSVQQDNLLAVLQAQDLPILIGEPFSVTALRVSGSRGEMIAESWTQSIHQQLGRRKGPARIVPQAQLSLWAHGVDHGIVVNIGQSQTTAIPVLNGDIAADAAQVSNAGSGQLTQLMQGLVARRVNSRGPFLMTWSRDLKEAHCYVAPPRPSGENIRSWLVNGGSTALRRVTVTPPVRGGEPVELAEELVLVPEAIFDASMGASSTLQELVLACAEQVLSSGPRSQDDMQDLLRNIVLVGGAADLPGIRTRAEFEVRAILKSRASQELRNSLMSLSEVFVLNPPLGHDAPITSPRFVPFVGGCVKAASSSFFCERDRNSSDNTEDATRLRNRAPRLSFHDFWLRARLTHLNPRIFRTGGGGGEDDLLWQGLLEHLEQHDFGNQEVTGIAANSGSDASSNDDRTVPERPTSPLSRPSCCMC